VPRLPQVTSSSIAVFASQDSDGAANERALSGEMVTLDLSLMLFEAKLAEQPVGTRKVDLLVTPTG